MASAFGRLRSIAGYSLERKLDEVSLHAAAVGKLILLVELVCTTHLILMQDDSSDLALKKADNAAHGSFDAASDVEHLELLAVDTDVPRQLVLVASDELIEGLVRKLIGEVEGGSPALFRRRPSRDRSRR